jgi:2-amino-4-hydroxy-6-hydroxymethyldihydropteridine diphosphokinase
MPRTGIALGSNLGDRLHHLRAARDLLRALSPQPASLLQAPVYQTAPVLCPDASPDFLNTVIELELDASPEELLCLTREIELCLGRPPDAGRNAPRVIDLDLLYSGGAVCATPDLVLPHPRLAERRFVLQPLADIRPELVLPGRVVPVAELLARLVSDEPPPKLVAAEW